MVNLPKLWRCRKMIWRCRKKQSIVRRKIHFKIFWTSHLKQLLLAPHINFVHPTMFFWKMPVLLLNYWKGGLWVLWGRGPWWCGAYFFSKDFWMYEWVQMWGKCFSEIKFFFVTKNISRIKKMILGKGFLKHVFEKWFSKMIFSFWNLFSRNIFWKALSVNHFLFRKTFFDNMFWMMFSETTVKSEKKICSSATLPSTTPPPQHLL